MAKTAVIGAGFSGLSAACYLSRAGHQVEVFEKNTEIGGRGRQFSTENGYVFDMGPSWYWMPDIFERFFADFGHHPSDFYDLELLRPAFQCVFKDKSLSVPNNMEGLCRLFESEEKGSAKRLLEFLEKAKQTYETAMGKMAYMPGESLMEFVDFNLIKKGVGLPLFTMFSKHVRNYFSNPKLIALMEFPVLFLGAMPQETPAMYSLMNYAGLQLGTWYPQGGFGKVVGAMAKIARENGAQIHTGSPVKKIMVENGSAKGLLTNSGEKHFDAIVASADYHHVEKELLPEKQKNYNEAYWEKKTFAPSCLIFYLGVSKKIKRIDHHTLFFEEDLFQHSVEIYKDQKWPTKPLFYVCCPSKTDKSVAPPGHENLFVLMPIAPGLEDTESLRESYFKLMMQRLEKQVGEPVEAYIDFKKSYCINDFVADYNSYKGNAYGLANTLLQTANFKPKIRNKKLKNFFYTGQLTVPGPGVPPSLISGKIVAGQVINYLKKTTDEVAV